MLNYHARNFSIEFIYLIFDVTKSKSIFKGQELQH